jgi:hypothetical protein
MHYKTRVNVYMVLVGGFGWYCSYLGGGFHVLVNLLVALVFGYGVPDFCNFESLY